MFPLLTAGENKQPDCDDYFDFRKIPPSSRMLQLSVVPGMVLLHLGFRISALAHYFLHSIVLCATPRWVNFIEALDYRNVEFSRASRSIFDAHWNHQQNENLVPATFSDFGSLRHDSNLKSPVDHRLLVRQLVIATWSVVYFYDWIKYVHLYNLKSDLIRIATHLLTTRISV